MTYATGPDATILRQFAMGGPVDGGPETGADGTLYLGCKDGNPVAARPAPAGDARLSSQRDGWK